MSFMSAEKILGKQINILHILARPLYFSRAELISFVVIAVCIQRVVFFFSFSFSFLSMAAPELIGDLLATLLDSRFRHVEMQAPPLLSRRSLSTFSQSPVELLV